MNMNSVLELNRLLNEEIEKYKDLTTKEILKSLKIDNSSKNVNHVIFDRIIENSKYKERIQKLLKECSCVVKTINLEWNNNLKESMSLSVFKYIDLYQEEWETSTLRKYFDKHTFVFVVFKKDIVESRIFKIKLWKMPPSILESGVKETWQLTKELISKGKIVNYIDKNGRYITYFPTSSETIYIHVRPHAQNREDTLPLPIRDMNTGKTDFMKHSFWLNSNFVKKIVVEDMYND